MKKTSKNQMAQHYAKALYDASVADGTLSDVLDNCKVFCDIFDNVKEFYILNNPELKKSQKQEVISDVSKQLGFSQTFENFLVVLSQNNRFAEFKNVANSFCKLYYKKHSMVEVMVQSVQPLNAKQQERLVLGLEKVLKHKIIINYSINPDILGGLVIEFGSKCIDDSIKGKLNRLEQVMKGNV